MTLPYDLYRVIARRIWDHIVLALELNTLPVKNMPMRGHKS